MTDLAVRVWTWTTHYVPIRPGVMGVQRSSSGDVRNLIVAAYQVSAFEYEIKRSNEYEIKDSELINDSNKLKFMQSATAGSKKQRVPKGIQGAGSTNALGGSGLDSVNELNE